MLPQWTPGRIGSNTYVLIDWGFGDGDLRRRVGPPQRRPHAAAQSIPATTPGGNAGRAVEMVRQIGRVQRVPVG